MKEHDVKLTLLETEQLCRMYMDCQLTVLEETELQYVLGKMPYSSPCIDEVRMLMGLSVPARTKKSSKERHGWSGRRIAAGIAASVAVLFVVGITLFKSLTPDEKYPSDIYIAYVDGHEISPELSEKQVKSDMEEADKFLSQIAGMEAQEQEDVENFLNQIAQ